MTRSKDVLTVLGMLCACDTWRSEFFSNPRAKAQQLVGELNADELAQIDNLAGEGERDSLSKDDFVARAKTALNSVWLAYDCPDPPCPKA